MYYAAGWLGDGPFVRESKSDRQGEVIYGVTEVRHACDGVLTAVTHRSRTGRDPPVPRTTRHDQKPSRSSVIGRYDPHQLGTARGPPAAWFGSLVRNSTGHRATLGG